MKKLILILALIVTSTASGVFAAEGDGFTAVSQDSPVENDSFQLVPENCGHKGQDECGWEDLVRLAGRIMTFVVYFSGILAVMAFCYAGFLYMTAFGNMGKVEEAHKIFGSAIIGVFFVLAGWLIVATVLKILVGNSDEAKIETVIDFKGVDTIQGQ